MKNKFKDIFIVIITVLILINIKTLNANAIGKQKVLILNSYDQSFKWTKDMGNGIESVLGDKDNIYLYYEFLDMKNAYGASYLNEMAKIYKEKYKDVIFDVIICSDNDALNFMVKNNREIFHSSPVVFCGVNEFNSSMLKGGKNFTGVIEEIEPEATIEAILKIQPNTKSIAVICDSSTTGQANEEKVKEVADKYSNRVNFYIYRDITAKDVSNNIEKLGQDTVLLDVGHLRTEDNKLVRLEENKYLLENLKVPMYVCWDFMMGDGTIGGKVVEGYSQGKIAGELALKIINGENPKNIPILKNSPNKYIFNYNEMVKYNVKINSLPKNSTVINKPSSFYESYKKIIYAALAIIAMLISFIIVLSINIKKRIDGEKKLKENIIEMSALYEELSATEEDLREQYGELQTVEEKNRLLAYHDRLTGLPNRNLFFEILNKNLEGNKKGALFLIDIDNFKKVNDTLGHDHGDDLLKLISERILRLIKTKDNLCRLGGDEFVIIQDGIRDLEEVTKLAEEILKVFRHPFHVRDIEIFTTVSIGITTYPEDGEGEKILLKNADTAMHKAKDGGKNTFVFYDVRMFYDIVRKTNLEKGLREAIEKQELSLVFQPQIDLRSDKTIGAETLLRWNSQEFGNISPAEFIPLAEETSFINSIGKWVLREACIKNKRWIEKGFSPITICVNVSVVQIQKSGFLEAVKNILEETKLPAEYLELEITESVLMNSVEENLIILNELKKLGVKIALDDFGTGYSSLSYLKILPINKLKLDKSFIDEIHLNGDSRAIVDGIIQLAHKIGIKVIAEGVETKEQLHMLKKINCDEIQGYYFSPPVNGETFESFI